ncbi:MAG: signal peptidase II [Oscillospiraceae bacterium]|nr:signal peptidase II [Clostridia bacterium]MBP3305498.1 signal peptidase II [Oscillospiraceae bacterium]
MQFLWMALFALGIAGADQLTKYFTVANIPLHGEMPFLPGIVKFTYVQNTGAAFSSFQGMQWLFALIFLVLTVLIILEYFKKPLPFSKFDRWCIAAVYGGGLGNMIDRLRLGYVVDMIETEFITFPVFNVADCFITCGCIALMIHLIFFNKSFWKEEKK